MKNKIRWIFLLSFLFSLGFTHSAFAEEDPFEQGEINLEDPAMVQSDGYFADPDAGTIGLSSAPLNSCSPDNAADDPNCICDGDVCSNHAAGGSLYDSAPITPDGNATTTGDVDTET